MNPIKDFERLEAIGLWREAGQRQRREVVISFGKSTLVFTDMQNNPLAHWSLATIRHLGSRDQYQIYAASSDIAETLEVADPIMIRRSQLSRAPLRRHARARAGCAYCLPGWLVWFLLRLCCYGCRLWSRIMPRASPRPKRPMHWRRKCLPRSGN